MNSIIKNIEQNKQFLQNEDFINSCLLREIFDKFSSEWNNSIINEKVEALQIITQKYNITTFELIKGMLDFCNQKAHKDIKTMEIIMGLCELIDTLIKEKTKNDTI